MSDPVFDLTKGLNPISFRNLCDYVSESIPFQGTNLFIFTRHRSIFEEKKAQAVQKFINDDDAFPEIWAEFKRSMLDEEIVALANGLKAWGGDGDIIAFARSTRSGKFELLPKSVWFFADLDLESGNFQHNGAETYQDPVFFLREDVPDRHPLHAAIQDINDPEISEQPGQATVEAHADEITGADYKTGFPGRPTSKQLIKQEFERRSAAGAVEPSLAKQAVVLARWLVKTHPEAPTATEKTIKNVLRDDYRRAKAVLAAKGPK